MNQLQVFNNDQFGQIRTLEEDGKVLFCGADIAKALGYAKPQNAITAHCKGALKRGTPTSSGEQEMSFIPESDVYRLIIRSKLPAAEQFEQWVMEDVLPSIRRTGSYTKTMTPVELLAGIAQELVGVERTSNAALQLAEATAGRVDELTSVVNATQSAAMLRSRISALCTQKGYNKLKLLGDLYAKLEGLEKCDLTARKRTKRERMRKAGAKKQEWCAISKIDVIAESSRLRQRFTSLLDELN